MKINGQAAIITGGGSGMGAETARQLAKAGAKVTVLDINEKAVSQVAEAIGGVGLVCDVRDPASVSDCLGQADQAHGVARILVNCAGVCPAKRVVGRQGPMPLEAFKDVIDVNLIGSFNVIRLFAAKLFQADPLENTERGVVINTASVAAYEGQIGQAAYSASKGGIVAMTLPIAREFASFGIRVMTIAPGIMNTPMVNGMPQEVQDSLAAQVPFPKRLGEPSEYAKLAIHILDNEMLNGEVIRLDGAIRMQAK